MLKVNNMCSNTVVKNLVMIDATGSMGPTLQEVKETIKDYFKEVCETLINCDYKDHEYFKLQIIFYRNYNAGDKILETSKWTSP